MSTLRYAGIALMLGGLIGSSLMLGGCSSDSRSYDAPVEEPKLQVTTQTIAFDSNGDGMPDIFQDAFDDDDDGDGYIDEVRTSADTCRQRALSELQSDKPVLQGELNLPLTRVDSYLIEPCYYRVNSAAQASDGEEGVKGAAPDSEDADETPICTLRPTDVTRFYLGSEVRYSLSLQSPGGRGDIALTYLPNITVISREDYEQGNFDNALDLELTHSDHSVRYANFSFVAPQYGEYLVLVSNSQAPDSENILDLDSLDESKLSVQHYCYSLFADDDKVGHTVCFIDDDGDKYTLDEIQYLRRTLAPYVKNDSEDRPREMIAESIGGLTAEQAYNQALAYLGDGDYSAVAKASSSLAKASSSLAKADSSLAASTTPDTQFRWDRDSTDLGDGYHDLGLVEADASAIEDFELPEGSAELEVKELNPPRFLTDCYEAKASFSEGFCIPALPIPLVPVTFSYSEMLEHSYGISSGTLLLSCVVREKESRLAKNYKMTESASQYLNRYGEAEFRQRYGDAFVAGALYGNYYRARLSFQATSSKEVKDVQTTWGLNLSSVDLGGYLKKHGEETFKNCRVCLQKEVLGDIDESTDSKIYFDPSSNTWVESETPIFVTSPKAALFNQLAQEYDSFKARAKAGQMKRAPLTAQLRHYSTLDSRLTPESSDTQERSLFAENIRLALQQAKGYLNEYTEQPVQYFVDGLNHLNSVKSQYNDAKEAVDQQLLKLVHQSSVSEKELKSVQKDAQSLSDRMRALAERCSFYVKLKECQAAIPSILLPEGVHGCNAYSPSTCVDKDILRGNGMICNSQHNLSYTNLTLSKFYNDDSFDGYCYVSHNYKYPLLYNLAQNVRLCFMGWYRHKSWYDKQYAYHNGNRLGMKGGDLTYLTIHTEKGGQSNYRAGSSYFDASNYGQFKW